MQATLLITGASRGIGAATALQAARAGYAVAMESAVLPMFAKVDARPGGLNASVNNAGVVDVGSRR
jgi:NAD(P)-dependent dehydrogenase (short-subunit alcohol dehydrogenase family)